MCAPVIIILTLGIEQPCVMQVLKVGCPDLVSLDCGKITGRGITMGSSFQVPQLANAHACFGPTPATQVRSAANLTSTTP